MANGAAVPVTIVSLPAAAVSSVAAQPAARIAKLSDLMALAQ